MTTPILDRVQTVFHKVFHKNDFTISPQMSAKDVKGWDSLTHVHLIVSLEKEFKIKFKNSEITSFKTVADLLASIEQKLTPKT